MFLAFFKFLLFPLCAVLLFSPFVLPLGLFCLFLTLLTVWCRDSGFHSTTTIITNASNNSSFDRSISGISCRRSSPTATATIAAAAAAAAVVVVVAVVFAVVVVVVAVVVAVVAVVVVKAVENSFKTCNRKM